MILGISGKKQAGKTTIANIFHGAVLKKNGMVQDYNVNENGKLIIKTVNNQGKEGWGEFDVERKDEQFIEYAHYNMWPYVKLYNFQNMKLMQKMPIDAKKSWKWRKGKMTAREFMQFFGTDIMRKIHPNVWANACINKITREGSGLAIIADVRFPNEVEAINKAGGKVLRLERDVHEDSHDSETALDADNYDHSKFWHVLNNREMTIQDTITEVKSLLEKIE